MRGIVTVLHSHLDQIRGSFAGHLTAYRADGELDMIATYGQTFYCAAMPRERIDRYEARPEYRLVCHERLSRCLDSIQILSWHKEDDDSYHLISAWACGIENGGYFDELLETPSPVGLMILAYYAALMSMRPNIWWFREWPMSLFAQVNKRLGQDWEDCLSWPRSIIERNTPGVIPRDNFGEKAS